MSFRKYGGTNKLEKNNNITVHSIVADTFTIRDAFLSVFTIDGDLQIGGNGIIRNNLNVSQQINAATLDISLNATIEGNLYLDKMKDVFLRGDTQMIGINKSLPTATLDISSNKVQAFNLKTSAANNRNIIARNLTNNGIAVTATGTSESGIQFYSANTGTIDVSNAQGAIIKYSNTDSLLTIDSSGGDVKVTSKMIITDNATNGNTHTSFGETVLIYDKDNGENQPVFFNEAYGNTSVKTGSALTVQSINNASNTFMNIVTPSNLGIQIGGGSYPKDPTRSMGVIDVYNPSIDIDATPSIVFVSGDSVTKYNSTTGFNTFQPKYNNYAVDINGPLHLNNGEIKKTKETTARITELYNYGANYGIAIGGQGINNDGTYSYSPYVTSDGGKSWTIKNPLNSSDTLFTIPENQTFNSVYSYSPTRTIVGGTGALAYVTDNAGINWLQLIITGGILTINAIYTPLDISKNFVYTGGDAGDGNAIIRYGYIVQSTFTYTLPGNPTVQRYAYADESYSYQIPGGIISDSAGYGQNLFVVGGNKIRKFDLGVNKMDLTLSSTYTNPGAVTYSAIRVADANNAVAVGGNVISYTKNGGTTWTTANIASLSGKTLNDVFLDGSMNAIVVGNNGYIYSSNDGYYTWNIVNENALNASGLGSRITDSTNDITSVFMPDSSTIILSIVKNNDSNALAAKLYYLNMPNIFNNKQNFLFDVSGCMRMSGDLIFSEGGEIISKDSTFNLLTENVRTLNAATNALAINMGGTNTTNIAIGGANTATLLAGGINTGNVIIGGNVTTSKIGPLNISPLTNGNVTLSNDLVTGNIFPTNAVISGNLQVTNGITELTSTLNSISATTGALQIYGGMGIQKDIHSSGIIYADNKLYTTNTQNAIINGIIVDGSNSFIYIEDSAPVQIKGGASIAKDCYLGGDTYIYGNLILRGGLNLLSSEVKVDAFIDAYYITVPFNGSSEEDVDYNSILEGSLTTIGGFAVEKNSWLRGNVRVDGIDGVTINATAESNSTVTGALQIRGGVGIGRNTNVGGNVIIHSSVESTSISTGALQIRGGVGIGGNVYTGGNVIINSIIESDSTITGALQIRGGVGIGRNLYTGGNVIINSIIESTSTNTGALRILGGVGIGGNVYTGGNVIINSIIESDSTITGALQIRGGVGIGRNLYTGGNVIINSTIESTSTNTGSLRIIGGVGIGGNVYTGGNVIINNTTESNSTVTGALQIRGGVGIGMNTNIGGNLIINSSVESTSISSGALQIRGGVGIGGNVYTGGNVIINSTIESNSTVTGALQIRGGVGIGRNTIIGGNVIINSIIESTSISSGALQIRGGVGISGNVYTGGNIIINSTIESNNTVTGALQIRGGVGIGRNLYTGGNVIINSTFESTSTVTGSLQVLGGVGIGGNTNIGGNVNIGKTTIIWDTTDSSSIVSGAFQVRGGMGVSNKIVSTSIATGQINATNLSLSSNSVSENTITGALIIAGGIGVGGSINTGGSVYTTDLTTSGQAFINSTNESTTVSNGAAIISGGLGVTRNANIGGNVIIYSTIESTSTVTGALQIRGGVGIGRNANIGGNVIINSIIASTSTNSGALQVRGGIGVGGSINTGGSIYTTDLTTSGQAFINSTNESTTVANGAAVIDGGLAVKKNANIGGNVIIYSTIESTSTNSGSLLVSGGIGIRGNVWAGGILKVDKIVVGDGNDSNDNFSIKLNTARPWSITTEGTAGGTALVLQSDIASKYFKMKNSAGDTFASFLAGSTAPGSLVTFTSDLTVTGASAQAAITASGLVTANAGLTVPVGQVSTLSNTTIIGSLNVTGGPLRVGGGTTLGGALNVTGISSLSDTTIEGLLTSTNPMLTAIRRTITDRPGKYGILVADKITVNDFTGIAFSAYNDGGTTVAAKGALLYQRTGTFGIGELHLCINGSSDGTTNVGLSDKKLTVGATTTTLTNATTSIVGNITLTNTTITGGLVVTGGSLNIGGATTLGGSLNVTGTSTQGIINASGMVTASAGLTVNTSLLYTGTDLVFWNFGRGGNTVQTGQLGLAMVHENGNNLVINYGGTNSFSGGVEVRGGITSNNTSTGSLRVVGGMAVSGNLNVGGTLTVTGATTLNNTLTVAASRATSLGGTLTVTGTATFSENIRVNNARGINITSAGGSTIGDRAILSLFEASNNYGFQLSSDAGDDVFRIQRFNSGGLVNRFAITDSSVDVVGTLNATTFNASSDERIKQNITDISGSSLEVLRKLKPREYTITDTNEQRYGFVAQEVRQHIPRSVKLSTNFIPSVYENAFVDGNKITLMNKSTTDISYCKLKLRDKNDGEVSVNVTTIHDNKTFTIDTDISSNIFCMDTYGNKLDKHTKNGTTTYMLGSQLYTGKVTQGIFVYGIQVDDFHSINHDSIWSIAVGATQEMDSQLQEARRTIRTLEERIAAIERRLS